MRVTLFMNQEPIGYLDYEVLNPSDMMGELGMIHTVPPNLALVLERKIKDNKGLSISGGIAPQDLSPYWDGVYRVLMQVEQEVAGFQFLVPPDEDPFKYPAEEGKVH
jgi:hypothetical protein